MAQVGRWRNGSFRIATSSERTVAYRPTCWCNRFGKRRPNANWPGPVENWRLRLILEESGKGWHAIEL